MKKRLLLAVVLLVLALGVGTALAGTEIGSATIEGVSYTIYSEGEEGEWYYFYPDDTSVSLFQYKGSATVITLPSSFDGRPVTSALNQAISDSFTSVTVPASFGTVPEMMFMSKAALKTVHLSEGITCIGEYAFDNCAALESVTFPATLTEIGYQAFCRCPALTSVSIPGGNNLVIGENAFYGCSSLSSLTLGRGMTEIGEAAFYQTALTGDSVSLPDSLRTIRSNAFSNINTLTELAIPAGVTTLDLPVVDSSCVMVLEDGSAALALILADGSYSNYRIRGNEPTPDVPVQTTAAEQVRAIVAAVVTEGMDDYQKALALHDYLTEHAQYNVCYEDEANDPYHSTNHEADGVLLCGTGVCESYTKAYGLLLDAVGIPNKAQHSDTHTWNVIQLDGKWYHVDVTWDDPTLTNQNALETDGSGNLTPRSGRESHTFFCLPDYALDGVSEHAFADAGIPAAKGWELNYAYVHGGLDSRLDQLCEGILAQLAAGNTSFTLSDLSAFNAASDGILDRTALFIAADNNTYIYDNVEYHIVDGYACDMTAAPSAITVTMEAINQDPVRIQAPGQAVLGEGLEISWAITDETFVYEQAQVMITEIKDDYRAFRSEDMELSGRSGSVRYTPTAGDTLKIRINFMDSEYNTLYTWDKTFELTGTPAYDLRMIDGTVTFSLNSEEKELEARYALSGGNGSIGRMEYMWEFYPEGGSSAEFYREGRMDLEGSFGTMVLATAVPGRYRLSMNLHDDSGWIKRIDNQGFSYTVSAADGNTDVSAEILPAELSASVEEQELTWKVRGGYTPFYYCDLNLQILGPDGGTIYEQTTQYQTEGTVRAVLEAPGSYSAVFTVTTCDKDGNDVVLAPITIPITAKSPLSLEAEAEYTYHVLTGECEFGWIGESFAELTLTGREYLSQAPAFALACTGPDGNAITADLFGIELHGEILAIEWNGESNPAAGDYDCGLTVTAPGFAKTVSFTVHVTEIEAPSGYNMEARWNLELNRTYTLNAANIELYPAGWYSGSESPVITEVAHFVNGEGDVDDLDEYMDFSLSADGKTFTYKPIRAGVYDIAIHCRLDYFEFYQQTMVVVPDETGRIPVPEINLMTTGRGLYFIYPDGGNMSMDEGLFGSWVGNAEALRIAGAGEEINAETCSVQQDAGNPQQLRLKVWNDGEDLYADLADGEKITVPGTYHFTFTVGWGGATATDDFTLTAETRADPVTTFSMASELDYIPGEPLVLDPDEYSFDPNDWCMIGGEMLDWLNFSAFIADDAAQAELISQTWEDGNLILTVSEAAVIPGRLLIDIGDGQIGVYSFPLTLKAEGGEPDPNQIGENVTYTLDLAAGSLIISGTGPMYDFYSEEVPPWYEVRDQIKTVAIGEGVTRVGEYAFRDCSSLRTVTMASVRVIGMAAFQECPALENVTFSGQLEEICTNAFDLCPALTSITLPASLKRIEGAAFAECGLTRILAEGSTVTWHFFYDAENGFELYHIDLPAGLEVVGEGAFFCNPLQHDTPDFVTPAALQTVEDEAFAGIAARYVWLSENVTGIGKNAFAGCPDLKYVYIPIDCASIGEGAFPSGTVLMGFADDDRIAWAERNGWIWITPENPFGGNG